MDPIKVDFTKKGTSKKDIVIPPEKAALKIVLSLIGALVTAVVGYYVMLPPLNPKATEFYMYIALVIGSYIALIALTSGLSTKPEYTPYVKKQAVIPGILIGLVAVVAGIGFVVSSVVLRADAYSKLMTVTENENFAEEVQMQDALSFNTLPKLDETAAREISKKSLSQLGEKGLVSQFELSETITQINYKGKPVRVVPLQYASLIKWFTNRGIGLPGYVIVEMSNQSTEFVWSSPYLEEGKGILYSPSEHFGRLLKRHLRFNYPTYMFAEPTFQLDMEGNPYWVSARLDKTIGLFGGTDVIGVVLVDAEGKFTEHTIEEVRKNEDLHWLNRVFYSDLVIEQYNYYGRYQNGFWNSVLGQKDVRVTTENYNYLVQNDDIYLYTGVTSVTAEQSIIGFLLVNQRTKEATFYRNIEGATETAAMGTAEGLVADLRYTATFPLLINVGGQPTYFFSLKDAKEIVQQFALINVKDYTKIKVNAKSVSEAVNLYIKAMRDNGIDVEDLNVPSEGTQKPPTPPEKPELKTKTGLVTEVRSAVINGNTQYYFKLDGGKAYYSVSAADAELAILVKNGDRVKISYLGDEKGIIAIEDIAFAPAPAPAD